MDTTPRQHAKEDRFTRWWDDVELTTRSSGGSVGRADREMAHEAWHEAVFPRNTARIVLGVIVGCIIGVLVADRRR
jgi:hypothetical protein